MSFEAATHLLNAIMSHEDSEQSKLALQLVLDPSTEETHICFSHLCKNNKRDIIDKNLKRSALFICYDQLPTYRFDFNIEDCSLLFENDVNLDDVKLNIIWIKKLIQHVKLETNPQIFYELLNAHMLTLHVDFFNGEPTILFRFFKYSEYLKINIFFSLTFDMSFKLQNVQFDCINHHDNYRQNTLMRFNHENQLLAFQLLLAYYSYPNFHVHLDDLIDVSTDLNDANLSDYLNILNMIII